LLLTVLAMTGTAYAQAGFAAGCGPFFSGSPNIADFLSGDAPSQAALTGEAEKLETALC